MALIANNGLIKFRFNDAGLFYLSIGLPKENGPGGVLPAGP
jgi:hypothetical protein